MKVYLASKFENKTMINSVGELLKIRIEGLETTNTWSMYRSVITIEQCAEQDYSDIDRSDFIVALFPFLSGACSEMGYALGKGIKVIYVVDRLFFDRGLSPAWGESHPLPCGMLEHFNGFDIPSVVNKLKKEDKGCIVHDMDYLIAVLNQYQKLSVDA